MKISVVEDELIIAWNLGLTLERMGHEVLAIVSTAEKAVQQARSENPNLILMDIRLKGAATGIDAAIEIRKYSDVPIVYLTGNEHLLSGEQIAATKPLGVFSKPLTDRNLLKIIEMYNDASNGAAT